MARCVQFKLLLTRRSSALLTIFSVIFLRACAVELLLRVVTQLFARASMSARTLVATLVTAWVV